MAKAKYWVAFNLQNSGSGYDDLSEVKKSTTAKTEPATYEIGKGLRGLVFNAKVVRLEAETSKEAMEMAQLAYCTLPGTSKTSTGIMFAGQEGTVKEVVVEEF
jgi:hypothetical protein